MKLGIRTISSSFYLFVSAMYGYSLWFNLTYIVGVGNTSISTYGGYGGKFKYLTFWNLVRYFVSVQSESVCGMTVCYTRCPTNPWWTTQPAARNMFLIDV